MNEKFRLAVSKSANLQGQVIRKTDTNQEVSKVGNEHCPDSIIEQYELSSLAQNYAANLKQSMHL